MNGDAWPVKAKETITIDVGFTAIKVFIENYWKLRGSEPGVLGDLVLSVTRHEDGMPFDEAEWGDWLAAIKQAKISHESN